MARTRDSAS